MFGVMWAAVIAVSAVSFEADGTTPAGRGGYTQGIGAGTVAWAENSLQFTTGNMSGTVAAVRQDMKGHRYLHIDSTVMNAPAGDPKFGDHVCLEK